MSKKFTAEEMKTRKFGKLRMKDPKAVSSGSGKKETWVCDCGKEKLMIICSIISGKATSCGRCNEISAKEMSTRKFGKLRIKDPKAILPGSNKKEIWICDCGKETETCISGVIYGKVSSCGRCNEISEEEMKIRKFGKLRMKNPKAILPGSKEKVIWVCDCGKEKPIRIYLVTSDETKSCGRCNEISAEEMTSRKFGKLRMKFPKAVKPGSHEKVSWICDCGQETIVDLNKITRGNTSSCGRCWELIHNWYLKHGKSIGLLKSPIEPGSLPPGGPIQLETITNANNPFKCQCVLCGNIYFPRLSDIKLNNGGLTCGCSTYIVSSGQKNVSLFIESLGFSTKLEYSVNKLKYDIFVPAKNLLIEYDGTHWHSMRGSKERDERKELNAIKHGYEFFRITEDEWIKSRKRVENQLRVMITNKLSVDVNEL